MTEFTVNQGVAVEPKHKGMVRVGTIFKHIGNFDQSLYILSQVGSSEFALISIEPNSCRWAEPVTCEKISDDWVDVYISKKDFDIIADNQSGDFAEVITINIDYTL